MLTVSVVTPSFQQAEFLKVCVASVATQGYSVVEHLILDGGSLDGTRAFLEGLGETSGVWWRSRRDGGQGAALNEGFSRATGAWVGWQNSDDFYYPGAFWLVAEIAARQPDVEVIVGDTAVVDARGVTRYSVGVAPVPPSLWLEGFWPYNQSVFFRQGILRRAGPVDESLHLHMDTDLLARVGLLRPRVAYLNAVLGAFRKMAGTKTESADTESRSVAERAVLRARYGRRMWPEGWFQRQTHRVLHHVWVAREWGPQAVVSRLGRRAERHLVSQWVVK